MQFFAGVLVGQRGGVVCVEVEENTRVGILRRAFIDEVNRDDKEKRIQCPADNVELFVAKVDGAWLPSRDERVQQLTIGEIPEDIQDILVGYPLDPTSSIRDICNGSTPEKTIQILIVPPPRSVEKASIGQLETLAPRRGTPMSLSSSIQQNASTSTQPVNSQTAQTTSTRASSLPSESTQEIDSVEMMDESTRDHLRQLAASIPRSKGKWTKVLQEYIKLNPTTNLTADNLRCRLKVKRARVHRDDTVTKEGTKRKRVIAACQSCHKAKMKCGADSKNHDCEYKHIPDFNEN